MKEELFRRAALSTCHMSWKTAQLIREKETVNVMTNQQHLELLIRSEANSWNTWRQLHPEIVPDLRGANLSEAILDNYNLNGADLREANLIGTKLLGAKLSDADLSQANLIEAKLMFSDLRGANLAGADLSSADLTGANLFDANLHGAILNWTQLRDALVTDEQLKTVKSHLELQ
jgi:Pentapeptide repeats (8 copies)